MALPLPESILIDQALVLLHEAGAWRTEQLDVLVEAGKIAAVGTLEPEIKSRVARRVDGRGKLLTPGLVNAHSHSPMNLCPGTLDGANHPAFMWLSQRDTAHRRPREVYISAMLGAMQMLLTGTTAVIDNFPEQGFDLADVEAVVAAYRDSGMRAVIALRLFDESYDDILPGAGGAAFRNPLEARSLAHQRQVLEDSIARWHGLDGRIQIFPAPSNPARCSDALLKMCLEIAERHDLGIHTHLLETQVQTEIAQRRYGMTMVGHLDRIGLLNERLTCAHCNWLTPEDIALMGERRITVAHNPESNQKLGSGVAPVPELLTAGATVCLGMDGANHNDNLVMHEGMKLAALLHRPRLADRRKWVLAKDALTMATLGGGVAMRLSSEIGRIAPGCAADLVLYDLSAPWWFPLNDPVQQLVHAETSASVEWVMASGRVLVEDRRLVAFDGDAIKMEAAPMLAEIRRRNAGLAKPLEVLASQF